MICLAYNNKSSGSDVFILCTFYTRLQLSNSQNSHLRVNRSRKEKKEEQK